jgi:hypothetical protein
VRRQRHVLQPPAGKGLREKADDEKREQDDREGIVHDRVGQALLPGSLFTFQVGIAASLRQFPGPGDESRPTVDYGGTFRGHQPRWCHLQWNTCAPPR